MGPDNMVRLYVGGLPGDVSPAQVAQRFQPFGTIAAVELVPEKGVVTAEPRRALSACRGFAYVQLTPKDAAALHRCISMVRMLARSAAMLLLLQQHARVTCRIDLRGSL